MSEKYEPSQEEIEKAEEMAVEGEMTPEQEKMSEVRVDNLKEGERRGIEIKDREEKKKSIKELERIGCIMKKAFEFKDEKAQIVLRNGRSFHGYIDGVRNDILYIRGTYFSEDREVSLRNIKDITDPEILSAG